MLDSSTVLGSYGLAGVVISAMAFVIQRQYSDNKALQTKYDALQEARRLDAKETTDKVISTMANSSEVFKLMYDKLQTSKEAK